MQRRSSKARFGDVAVLTSNAAGIIVSSNHAVKRILGYDPEDIHGECISFMIPPPYKEQHDAYIQRYLHTGQSHVMGKSRPVEALHKDGRVINVSLGLSHIKTDGLDMFSAILEPIPDNHVIVEADCDGRIQEATANVVSVFGWCVDELIGKNIRSLVTRGVDRAHGWCNELTAIASHEYRTPINSEGVHKAGHTFPVCMTVDCISRAPITYRVEIDIVLGETTCMVTVTQDFIIHAASQNFYCTFGYKTDELLHQPVSKLCPDLNAATLLRNDATCTVKAKHKDGSRIFVRIRAHRFTSAATGTELIQVSIRRKSDSSRSKRTGRNKSGSVLTSGQVVGHYVVSKVLGSGFFGQVMQARHRLTYQRVAIKTLRRKQYEEVKMEYPPREVSLLKQLRHPNIMVLYDVTCSNDRTYLITELANGGELFDYVTQQDHLSERKARGIFRQLLSAVDYMHRKGIVHRDLKMENVLFDADGNVKIIDLGLGQFWKPNQLLSTFCGSADYAAPELWRGEKYPGPAVDVWSLGVVLFIMVTGFLPFPDSAHAMVATYRWPSNVAPSHELTDLMQRIFVVSVRDRISVPDMMSHPWVCSGYHGGVPQAPLDTRIVEQIDESIVDQVVEMGFPREAIIRSLQGNEHNELIALYCLAVKRRDHVAAKARRKAGVHAKLNFGETESDPVFNGALTAGDSREEHCTIL